MNVCAATEPVLLVEVASVGVTFDPRSATNVESAWVARTKLVKVVGVVDGRVSVEIGGPLETAVPAADTTASSAKRIEQDARIECLSIMISVCYYVWFRGECEASVTSPYLYL